MPTLQEVRALHDLPLPELLFRAQTVHREHHAADEVQLCTLLSVKTGGCPEDCAYCPQSVALRDRRSSAEKSLAVDEVLDAAAPRARRGRDALLHGRRLARGQGRARVRQRAGDGARRARARHGGVLHARHAHRRCRPSGSRRPACTAYNHNLDTSRQHYKSIITTRTYDDRLRTLDRVRKAGITVCSGGIIGMGESIDDRCEMLRTLAIARSAAGERADQRARRHRGHAARRCAPVDPLELVRMIATARILMPRARVRLSAGRLRCRARRSCSASSPAPTRSSTARSC